MVSKYSDYDETGQWTIKTKDMKTEKVTDHVFDAVMICTGHHAEKNMPSFPGLSNFKGKVLHSHDYRKPEGLEGKNVLVIGIGNSGGDVATELSRFASKVCACDVFLSYLLRYL
jgi:dimethylaniline monooxygenase (N-oxide forming)